MCYKAYMFEMIISRIENVTRTNPVRHEVA
jgi:hypothetical protein